MSTHFDPSETEDLLYGRPLSSKEGSAWYRGLEPSLNKFNVVQYEEIVRDWIQL